MLQQEAEADGEGVSQTAYGVGTGINLSSISPETLFGYIIFLIAIPVIYIGTGMLKALETPTSFSAVPLKLGKVDE